MEVGIRDSGRYGVGAWQEATAGNLEATWRQLGGNLEAARVM